MTLIEKTAYLKGLLDGMNKEDKVVSLIADILRDIALELEDHQDQLDEICEVVDSVSEDLDDIEDDLYSDDDDGFDDDDFDDDEEMGDIDPDSELYEATCPTCGDTIVIDKKMLEQGSIDCPNCGELLEFDTEDDEEISE